MPKTETLKVERVEAVQPVAATGEEPARKGLRALPDVEVVVAVEEAKSSDEKVSIKRNRP